MRATNCATPRCEVVGLLRAVPPKPGAPQTVLHRTISILPKSGAKSRPCAQKKPRTHKGAGPTVSQQPQPLLQPQPPLLQPHPQPPQPPPQQHQMIISRMIIQQQFPPPPQPLLQHISVPPMRLRCRPFVRPQSIVCGPMVLVQILQTGRGDQFAGLPPFTGSEDAQIHQLIC